jgi:hypothetical protein
MDKILVEAGHYYQCKGVTTYSYTGREICYKIKKVGDKTMLFIDNVHNKFEMFDQERNIEDIPTDNKMTFAKAFHRGFDFIIKESELLDDVDRIFDFIKRFGKVKHSKTGKYFSGIKLFHANNYPTCVMLDVCLTFRKRGLGYSHLINILPEFYLPQQQQLKKIISRILPEIKFEVLLFSSEESYRYL